ncbi:MAG: GerMN domain-containing protein [Acetivibrionales bacterium]|jgi:germination protein M
MKKIISIATLFVFFALMLPGCGVLEELGLQESRDDEFQPVSSIVIGESEASKLTEKTPVRLYFANADNTKLKLEIRYIDLKDEEKNASTLASAIINELIRGPSNEATHKRTIPAEAKLRTPVSISKKVATVDMSKEFKTKHPGGKDAEKMTIYSIVNSLTELEEIEKVKFTIEGKSQKEFMGNFKFDALFPRSSQLISKEGAEASVTTDETDAVNLESGGTFFGDDPEAANSRETAGGQDGETIDGLDILE